MNKLIVLIVAALVACAQAAPSTDSSADQSQVSQAGEGPRAGYEPRPDLDVSLLDDEEGEEEMSQKALFESDEVEAGNVRRPEFRKYCIESRDDTKVFLNRQLNNAAMKVFNALYKAIDKATEEVVQIKDEHKELGMEFIKKTNFFSNVNADEAIEEYKNSDAGESEAATSNAIDEDDDDDDDENKEEQPVQQKWFLWRLVDNVVFAVQGMFGSIAAETWVQFEQIWEELKGENFQKNLELACGTLTDSLQKELKSSFRKFKADLLGFAKGPAREEISAVSFDNVNCVTTKRVSVATNVCGVVKKYSGIFFPFFNFWMDKREKAKKAAAREQDALARAAAFNNVIEN